MSDEVPVKTMGHEAVPVGTGQVDIYKCSQCTEVFLKPVALKRHFRIHINDPAGPLVCGQPGCSFSSADRHKHQSHLTSAHGLALLPCTFPSCRASFLTQPEMERHRSSHVPFGCFHCQFVCQSAREMSEHVMECSSLSADSSGKQQTEIADTNADGNLRPPVCKRLKRKRSKPSSSSSLSSPRDGKEDEPDRDTVRTEDQDKDLAVDVRLPSKEYLPEDLEHIYRTHTCPSCRRCFSTRSHLQEHLRLHSPDPRLQCPTCRRCFPSSSKLRAHRLREAGDKVHRCPLCEYAAVERSSVRRHLVTMHAGSEAAGGGCGFPCPACGQSFGLSRQLKAHMKTHEVQTRSRAAACFHSGCSFTSPLRKDLLRHAADAHGVKAVPCRHHACRAVFKNKTDMETHYGTHRPYHCQQCSFSCSNKTLLLQHRRRGHAGTDKLRCEFCAFVTFNPVELEQHVAHLHANEKTHQCSLCSYVSSHSRSLKRHMLTHSGEKPFKCNVCEFRCRDESYLSKHRLTHSDDRNFLCTECGYVTKWKHYLNVHMRKHAGDLRFQCDQCPYRCHRPDQLSSHKLRHQDKSLMCEICAYACKRKQQLRSHMLSKHSAGGRQATVHRCRYCPFTSSHRQALQNHENCKHTKIRQFHCALCLYTSFSGVSLFLHKKKAHGYVPGDRSWLENYAEKEKERNAAGFLPELHNRPPGEPKQQTDPTEPGAHGAASLSVSDDAGEDVPPVGQGLKSQTEEQNPDRPDSEEQDPSLSASRPSEDDSPGADEERDEEETSSQPENRCLSPQNDPLLDAESRLKALKKHDQDQARALVLEGRVQILVVPAGGVSEKSCKATTQDVAPREAAEETSGANSHPTNDVIAHHVSMSSDSQRPSRINDQSHISASNDQQTSHKECEFPSVKRLPVKPHVSVTEDTAEENRVYPNGEFECNQRAELESKSDQVQSTRSRTCVSRQVVKVHRERRSGPARLGSASSRQRPHSCGYCAFSTRRRHRLQEHESLHTGLGRHSCDLCDKTFAAVTRLHQHQKRVHDKRAAHRCSLCDFAGFTPDDVKRHRVRCHGGALCHACARCDARFTSEAALRCHCGRVHPQVPVETAQRGQVTCPECRRVFDTTERLEVHRRLHLAHRCPLCPFAARSRKLLAGHLLDEHEDGRPGDQLLVCSSCPFTCRHQLVLEQHLRSHGGRRVYSCSDCTFSSSSRQKITWHVRTHTGEKPYRCEQCVYTCSEPSRLKLHMRVHQQEKKFLCPDCGYKCKWATQLKYHMTKHTGEKPYACDQCEYRTNRADALRAHRDTQHCSERPFVCEKCGKAFKTRFILKTHQQQHSGERPYTCGLCHKTFRWPAGLRHHFLSHTKQQPFCCRHCSYRAKQKFQVVKHLRRHHPEVSAEQGVLRDTAVTGLTLKEALQGALDQTVVGEDKGEEGSSERKLVDANDLQS